MKTNLLTLVVTLTVGVIFCGSLLMPVVTDAANTHYTNVGVAEMDEVNSFTITKTNDSATKLNITIDGYTITDPVGVVVYSDQFILNKVSGTVYFITSDTATNINGYTLSGVYENGIFTYTIGTNETTTLELTNVLVAKEKGNYVSIHSNDQTIYAKNVDDVRGWGYFSNELFTSTGLSAGPSESATVTLGLSNNSFVKSDMEYSDGGTTAAVNEVIVPKDVYIPNEYNALYGAIPVLVIMSLVVAAVGVIVRGRSD